MGVEVAALEVDCVTKDYRNGTRANDGISLRVVAGEVFGLLGHNGAGKTTLLSQVIGITRPTSGSISIEGKDAVANPKVARRACSVQPQAQAPLDAVTPAEAIELMARIRGAHRRQAKQRAAELIEALDIGAWANARGERLSGGVRRLAAFAMAAAEPGRLVMFDEPTNDVDPVRRRLLWAQVRMLAETGCAVLLVTHNVIEAERVVDRLAILDRGRVVAHGTPTDIRGDRADQLRLEAAAASSAVAHELAGEVQRAGQVVVDGRRILVSVKADECPALISWVQGHRASGRIGEFSLTPVSLEDVYIRLAGMADNNGKMEAASARVVA